MAKEMLLDKLKRLSDAAFERASRRNDKLAYWNKKGDDILESKAMGHYGKDTKDYYENVVDPNYRKYSKLFNEADDLHTTLNERLYNEQRRNKNVPNELISETKDFINWAEARPHQIDPSFVEEMKELKNNGDYTALKRRMDFIGSQMKATPWK